MSVVAVLSDMDGVLVDSAGASQRAWRAWGRRNGVDGAAIQAANHGRPARDVIARHVAAAVLQRETDFVRDAEIADTEGLRPFAGAAGILALPRVAVVTSCEGALARARLRGAGLVAPAVLVTSDMVPAGKPAPDAYLMAATRLGVPPEHCVVIEDAPAGIAAGRAAGMTVWAVATTHDARDLGGAHRIATSLADLLDDLAPSPA